MSFPSPARDYQQNPLDLNDYLVQRPSATFFFRLDRGAVSHFGFCPDDLLIVDRSLSVAPGRWVIASYENQFSLVRVTQPDKELVVQVGDQPEQPLSELEIEVWGIVIGLVRQFSP